ncbi:MAG: hypothetical protein WBP79_06855, partial [Candidatus Acidiferrales bacterium]
MSKSLASRIFFTAFIVAMAACTASAQVTIRNYRYRLSTRSHEPAFATEISSTVDLRGTRYEVESDPQGRTTRIAVIRKDKKLSETFFRFAGDAKLPNGYENFDAGQITGTVAIKRNDAGDRIREDYFTVGGTLTEYMVYT